MPADHLRDRYQRSSAGKRRVGERERQRHRPAQRHRGDGKQRPRKPRDRGDDGAEDDNRKHDDCGRERGGGDRLERRRDGDADRDQKDASGDDGRHGGRRSSRKGRRVPTLVGRHDTAGEADDQRQREPGVVEVDARQEDDDRREAHTDFGRVQAEEDGGHRNVEKRGVDRELRQRSGASSQQSPEPDQRDRPGDGEPRDGERHRSRRPLRRGEPGDDGHRGGELAADGERIEGRGAVAGPRLEQAEAQRHDDERRERDVEFDGREGNWPTDRPDRQH